jgi:putative membrane protein
MVWWQKLLLNTIVFLSLAGLIEGFHVESFWTALIASIILGILNLILNPILQLLSLPITLLTFGLFSLVINAAMLSLTAAFLGTNFHFQSFWITLLVSALLSLINSFLNNFSRS